MAWWGRVIGGSIGLAGFGPLGAMLGYYIGSKFDRGFSSAGSAADGPQGWTSQERIQTAFFTATFSVLGYVSKLDGHVSPQEIQYADFIMKNMSLSADQRRVAIGLFNVGKGEDFQLDPVLKQFSKECRNQKNIKSMFVQMQLGGAISDGKIDAYENESIRYIADYLGFSVQEYEQMYNSVASGYQVSSGGKAPSLSEDFKILGLSEDADDADIKRAYRRKMSQMHPDKLVSKGLPDEMIEVATEKTKQIRAAYDRIREVRKQSHTVH